MNQSDLSSWMLAGSYVVKAQVPHRYQLGMSYSLQRYEGGNAAALGALADTARNVGSVFAYDEWQINRYVAVSYGAHYARYDYMVGPAMLSPNFSADLQPDGSVASSRLGIARGQRARRGRIHSADLGRVPSAPAHVFAALEGRHSRRRSC